MAQLAPPQRFTIVESNDLDEVEEQIATRYRRINLNSHCRRRAPTRFGHVPLPNCALKVGFFQTGSPTELETRETLTFFPVLLPLSGSAEVDCGGKKFDANLKRAIIPRPNDRLRMRTDSDYYHLVLRLEMQAVESCLAALLGHPLENSLVFDRGWNLDAGTGPALVHLAHNIHRDLELDESLLARGLTVRETEQLLINVLLYSHRHSFSDELSQVSAKCPLRFVRRARAYLEEKFDQPLTITELANEVGVSGRTLFRGFRDSLGTTPMAYLRDVRLEAVHRELIRPDSNESVTDLALRFGFNHLGRFAAGYRARFGETPSQSRHRRA